MGERPREDHLEQAPPASQRIEPTCHPDHITCPVCGGPGVEKKQKWFCARCGQLLQTCCD